MKAVISLELYEQAQANFDFSPFYSFDEFLNEMDILAMGGSSDRDLNYRQLRILATVIRKGNMDGLNSELLYDHFTATGDREYSKEAYLADTEQLKHLDLLSDFSGALTVVYASVLAPVMPPFQGEELQQPWLFSPLPVTVAYPFSPSPDGTAALGAANQSLTFENGGAAESPQEPFDAWSSSSSGVGYQPTFAGQGELASPVLDPFPSQQTEAVSAQPLSQSRKRKRSEGELEEQASESGKSSSYAKILQELSFLRRETKEIKEGMAEMKAQMTQIVGLLQPSFHLDAGFFGLPDRPSSLGAATEDSELDQEVAMLTDRPRAPTPFQLH